MAKLDILTFPDPRLRTKAKPVDDVNDDIRTLVEDMFETMYAAPGIGLAATQVDVHQRVIVMDISEEADQPRVFINPEILERDGIEEMEEGCLSVPGAYEKVKRAEYIKVRALDKDGESYELEAHGLLAVCIQHEMDHLDGKLFVDRLSGLKRQRLKKRMEQARRNPPRSTPDEHADI